MAHEIVDGSSMQRALTRIPTKLSNKTRVSKTWSLLESKRAVSTWPNVLPSAWNSWKGSRYQ